MACGDQVQRQVAVLILALVAAALVLGTSHALPGIDLNVSSLFCGTDSAGAAAGMDARTCRSFPVSSWPAFWIVRKILFYLPPTAFVLLLVAIGRAGLFDRLPDAGRQRALAFAALAYFTGPILIANMMLKAWSGRPRPYQSLIHGSDMAFVPAGDFSGACRDNCSFVSGEAAAAGWLLWLIPLLPRRWRGPLARVLIAASVLTPLLRVAMGGHFLSDALLGWLLGVASLPLVIILATLANQLWNRRLRFSSQPPT